MLKRAVMVCALALAGPVLATDGLDPLVSFLETNGVRVDHDLALHAATDGFLKALDPGARFCTVAEAAVLRAEGMGTAGAGTAGVAAATFPTVESLELWPEAIAYLKVRGFRQGSGAELLAHLDGLANSFGIVIDLRGADGFDLGSVVELASPYHCPGESLYALLDTHGTPQASITAVERAPLKAFMMVLTDRDTRGAAETLTALWRGRPGIMLVGAATRGDSRVRDILTLPDGRLLVMVTRRVVPAESGDYEGKGIPPDVQVAAAAPVGGMPFESSRVAGKPMSAKSIQDRELMIRVDSDAVLRRAVDILLGLRALKEHGHP